MSRFNPHVVALPGGSRRLGQMSHPKEFAARVVPIGGRGRDLQSMRRVHGWVHGRSELTERDAFLSFWSGLLLRRLGSARAVAQAFSVTEQTGRNWIDGFACPSGHMVFQAQERWPDDFPTAHRVAA